MQTREEHMEFCKKRAREYLNRGDITNAITSMLSDLSKHPETKKASEAMGPVAILYMMHGSKDDAERFIEGFR